MTVPAIATYSVAAKVAAHTAFRDLIDAGDYAGSIGIYSANDGFLASIPLARPCGAVDGATGQLTFVIDGAGEVGESSVAVYAALRDGFGNHHLTLPVVEGGTGESGVLVLNSTTLVSGAAVSVISAVMG